MRLLRVALAIVALAAAMVAQQAADPPSFTYFIADEGLPLYSMEALAVGPRGDIWGVGVSEGDTLPIVDPDSNPPPSGECQTGGFVLGSITPAPRQLATGSCTDVVVFRLAGDGSGIVFSKYLGGAGADSVADIAVGEDGVSYVIGSRADSPDTQPYVSAYLVGLAPDGRELFDLELPDALVPRAIALDREGDIYIGGDHAVYGVVYEGKPEIVVEFDDVVALKLDGETREVIYEATLDDSRVDEVDDLTVDENGQVYLAGVINSATSPGNRPRDRDVFVRALDPTGQWTWAATLGGSAGEWWSPLVHWTAGGELLVAGITESADFPDLSDNTATEDEARFWNGVLDPATGMWLRGEQIVDDKAFSLEGVAEDAEGNLYLSGRTRVTAFVTPGFASRLETGGGAVSAFLHAGAYVTRIAARGDQLVMGGTTLPGLVDAGPARPGFTEAFYVQPLEFEQSAEEPRLAAVLNAAGRLAAELSPGAVVSLYGQGLGPDESVPAAPAGGILPTEVAGVRVRVGGQAVPLLFVSEGQINAVLPSVLGPEQLIEVRVEHNGESSNVFLMTQAKTAPEAFPVVINADGSLNSAQSPAPRGTAVSVWLSGVGAFSPPRPDGVIEGTTGPYPQIDAPGRAGVQGEDAVVTYAGAAPGLVAGVAQVNFVIPEQILPANDISFAVSVGEGPEPPGTSGRVSVSQ